MDGVENALQVDFVGHRAIDEAMRKFIVTSLDEVHFDDTSNKQLNHEGGGVVGIISADFRFHFGVLGLDPAPKLQNAILNGWIGAVEYVVVIKEVE